MKRTLQNQKDEFSKRTKPEPEPVRIVEQQPSFNRVTPSPDDELAAMDATTTQVSHNQSASSSWALTAMDTATTHRSNNLCEQVKYPPHIAQTPAQSSSDKIAHKMRKTGDRCFDLRALAASLEDRERYPAEPPSIEPCLQIESPFYDDSDNDSDSEHPCTLRF